ncbi:MAG: hypothetical protein P1T08_01560 [Acidimicrobiia bacterium]|nr:hypothetical protein [Acidimicrobiia bacterium]
MALEQALLRSLRWLMLGLAISPFLLLLPQPESGSLLTWSTLHVAMIVLLGFATMIDLSRYVDQPMFTSIRGDRLRRFTTAGSLVALDTGVVALVTLATSAALRLDPSLQFLQLLSTLDIAWSVAALYFGVRWLTGEWPARLSAGVLSVICIWSIWNYLRIVGFSDEGGWLIDGSALVRWVLPFDAMAALLALGSLGAAVRQPIAQRSPQS